MWGGDEGALGFGEAEGLIDGLAAVVAVSAWEGAQWLESVWVLFYKLFPDTGAAYVVVALLGGEDCGDEDGHGDYE